MSGPDSVGVTLPAVKLRPATAADMTAIFEIYKHYTLETVATFKVTVTSEAQHVQTLKQVQSQRLPYIVAVLPGHFREGREAHDFVAGYAYCSGFRSGKGGYRHTVELSLYCHPEYRSQGIGTLLLNKLLEVMAAPDNNKEWIEGGNVRGEDSEVRHIIACIAVDETGKDSGCGLVHWYEKFGFVQVGHLKKVGHKFDRW